MITITLAQQPNQSLDLYFDSTRYNVTIKETIGGGMAATIARNGVTIISGVRCIPGTPLLPYEYLEQGNFMFITENDELPTYSSFGDSQTFVYFTLAEIAELSNG